MRSDDPHADEAARWLDREIIGRSDRAAVVKTLIQSIDRLARVRAWRAVELNLADRDDRAPRAGIMRALQQREDQLEEIGERPGRLERREVGPTEGLPTEWVDRPEVETSSDRDTYMRSGGGQS